MIWLSVNFDFFTQNFLLGKFYFLGLGFIGGITKPHKVLPSRFHANIEEY